MTAMEAAANRDWPILSSRPLTVPGLPTATFMASRPHNPGMKPQMGTNSPIGFESSGSVDEELGLARKWWEDDGWDLGWYCRIGRLGWEKMELGSEGRASCPEPEVLHLCLSLCLRGKHAAYSTYGWQRLYSQFSWLFFFLFIHLLK